MLLLLARAQRMRMERQAGQLAGRPLNGWLAKEKADGSHLEHAILFPSFHKCALAPFSNSFQFQLKLGAGSGQNQESS